MEKFFIKQLAVGPMQNFAYLVGDAQAGKVAVIDPGWDVESIVAEVKAESLTVVAIFITHTHFDHIQALGELLERFPVPVYVHEFERERLPASQLVRPLRDGDSIDVGSITVRCHHTPGHSPGLVCFEVDGALFTGDALFVDGCGRIDLPGSDPEAMAITLKKLAAFSADTVIYPGHDYGPTPTSTIGDQLKTNPYLRQGERKKPWGVSGGAVGAPPDSSERRIHSARANRKAGQ